MSAGEREASVKVSLNSAEFLGELRKMAQELKEKSEEGRRKFQHLGKGIDAAKSAMSGLAATAKQGLGMALTFGGAFSTQAAIRNTVALDERLRALAFRATTATGKLVTAADVNLIVDRSAAKASRTTDEMAGAFEELYAGTGDLDFTTETLGAIGTTATGTGKSVETLTTLADQLHTKFGVTASGMDQAFADIYDAAGKGGPKFEEYADRIGLVGANVLNAGLSGQRGLRFLIGALIETDDKMGGLGQQVSGLNKLMLNLGKGSEIKAMAKDLGIASKTLVNEKDAIARLRKILSYGQAGLKTLKANFVGPEEQKALKILFTDTFEEAYNLARKEGKTGKEATAKALAALDKKLADFGNSTTTAKTIQDEATKNMQTPAARLRDSMRTLNEAFMQPEIIEGINDLASQMPRLAGIFGGFISFAAKNPLLSGALGVGGHVGLEFLSATTKSLMEGFVDAHKKGAIEWAKRMLAGAGGWGGIAGAAMNATMVAGAGALGYAIGMAIAPHIIDPLLDGDLKKTRDVEGATEAAIANTAGGGSTATLKKRLAELDMAIAQEKQAKLGQDFGSQLAHTIGGGPDVSVMSAQRLARAEEARRDLNQKINDSIRKDLAPAAPAAEKPVAKAVLDRGVAREIAFAVADGLGGKTLQVAMRSTTGSGGTATGRSFGSRGPREMAPPQQGGGL